MREIKDPEVRKAEIMEAAKKLFYTKGYLNTTTQDIIEELHISRGLLYYHFKSKEDILLCIVEKYIEPIVEKIKVVACDDKISAQDKIKILIESTIVPESSITPENYCLQETLDLAENSFMMDKISHRLSYCMTEYFANIIKQGNSEGIFQVEYPEETAAFLMTAYAFVANDRYFHNHNTEKATRYFNAFKQLLNHTLGTKEKIFKI